MSVLKHAKISKQGMITKTSIMLGLGETDEELKEAMADLRAIDVDILTLGQYLQVKKTNLAFQTSFAKNINRPFLCCSMPANPTAFDGERVCDA